MLSIVLLLKDRYTPCQWQPLAFLPANNGGLFAGISAEFLAAASMQSKNSSATKPPLKLESVGGAVPLDSEFYVVRPTDFTFRDAIAARESIVLVKGARQMGKTSLLARGLQQARVAGAKVILTDVQKLNTTELASAKTFLFTLADLVSDQLDLPVLPHEKWENGASANANFERFVESEVLSKLDAPLVWGLDEVDRLFAVDYSNDIFSLFRSWHNQRALNPQGPWSRLTLAISYATEASLFIRDLNQSPFNVGTRLTLEDFTIQEVAELNRRYSNPLRSDEELTRFFSLVGGQPFLVRRGLHEMVTNHLSLGALERQADSEDGIFGDHLRRIPLLLAEDPDFREIVRGILLGQMCPTLTSFYRLRSAGLMSGTSETDVRPRCRLYATYLARHLL